MNLYVLQAKGISGQNYLIWNIMCFVNDNDDKTQETSN